VVISFDVWRPQVPLLEVYGETGSLQVPDPNTFGGPVRLFPAGAEEWQDVRLTHGYTEHTRSIGLADMLTAEQSGRPHRCSGELAFHVLDIMLAFQESSDTGRHIDIASRCEQPAALPTGLAEGELDR
jgi:predicted dehydrogenase